MSRPTPTSLILALPLCLLAGCAGSGSSDTDTTAPATSTAPRADVTADASETTELASDVPILGKVSGQDLRVSDPMLGLVNQTALEKLGLADRFAQDGVQLDPQQHSVVLLSLGQCETGGYAADISALQRKGDELFVEGTATAPDGVDQVTQEMTYPFCAVAIEKVASGTKVRSDIKSLP